jgi:hypothetical protein
MLGKMERFCSASIIIISSSIIIFGNIHFFFFFTSWYRQSSLVRLQILIQSFPWSFLASKSFWMWRPKKALVYAYCKIYFGILSSVIYPNGLSGFICLHVFCISYWFVMIVFSVLLLISVFLIWSSLVQPVITHKCLISNGCILFNFVSCFNCSWLSSI